MEQARRHYGLDWLRIGAFGLLILYHIGMYFSEWPWIVKTQHPVHWLAYPMLALTPWRLDLLFFVSGYASRMMLGREGDPLAFTKTRSLRLLLPLAFAWAVLLPPEMWVRVAEAGQDGESLGRFWLFHYYRIGRVGGVDLPSVEHLWFVSYLWAYTMLLCAGLLLIGPATRARIARGVTALGEGPRLLWMPIALLIVFRWALMFVVPDHNGLFTDWTGHLHYPPLFLAGFALASTPALWSAVGRLWRAAGLVALICYVVIAGVEWCYPGDLVPPHLVMMAERAARAAMGWSMILLLLEVATRWLNRDHKWRKPLSEAIFPAYIAHHVPIVLIGWWLAPMALPHMTEFAILLAGTIAACLLFLWIGRRAGPFALLFGLKPGLARPGRSARALAT